MDEVEISSVGDYRLPSPHLFNGNYWVWHRCAVSLYSSLRMTPIIHLDHLLHRYLSVDLRRREPCVAEEFLDVAKVGSLIEQVRRERVPQAVGRDVVDVGTELDVFVDHAAD